MELSILIVSHAHGSYLPPLLQSLSKASQDTAFEIHLLHNLPETVSIPDGLSVVTATNPIPLGLSANLNLLAAKIKTPFYLILNPDTLLPEKTLQQALAFLKKGNFDLITCKSRDFSGRPLINLRYFPTPFSLILERSPLGSSTRLLQQNEILHEQRRPFWFQGSFLMGKTEVLQKIGFDTHFHLYFEDVDFCLRHWQNKYRLGVCKEAHFLHHFRRQSAFRSLSHLKWHLESMLYYFKKHGYSAPLRGWQ